MLAEALLKLGMTDRAAASANEALGEANYGKLDLGRLLLADEPPRFEQAEGYLKDALAQFRQEGQADKEAEAQALLARIYAGQRAARKDAMALSQAALAEADRLAAKSENLLLRITVLLAEAEVRRAAGEAPKALELLRKARAEAESRQLVPLALEAREELGGIELCCGDRRRGEKLLRAVGTDARERGLLQVARRAAKLLAPPNSSFPGP